MSTTSRRAVSPPGSLPAPREARPAAPREFPGPRLRFHHYRAVYWVIPSGPFGVAYTPVVVHDDCPGCLVCEQTTGWFLEFSLLVKQLLGINLRDCLHWRSLADNPQPLIVPASNLGVCNRATLPRLRAAYYARPEAERPRLGVVWPRDRALTQSQRFEDRLQILARFVELWEDGQYIGWPS
jgi:hypothetical protein